MEELLRGYVYTSQEQFNFYFVNTLENIASFIFANSANATKIVIENIFGNELIKLIDNTLTGNEKYLSKVQNLLNDLYDGNIQQTDIKYIDLSDTNNRDEFDSKDLDEKDLIKLYDGH